MLEGTRGRRAAAQVSRSLTKRHAKGTLKEDEDKDENFEDMVEEDDDVDSPGEDETDRPGKKRKVSSGAPAAAGPSWNKSQRERLKNSMFRFGFGR